MDVSFPRVSRNTRARVIAFYLPQFHPIPENDAWWGEGFTEWTNVRKARRLFRGHSQPRVPGSLGYYDLRNAETRQMQAALAEASGIEAFAYWHYWFGDGRRLLEAPFDAVLRSGQPDFPFCLCWANQTWTGVWHGAPGRILMEQTYPGDHDEVAHFNLILPALRDPRYVRINGLPLFLVYHPLGLPNAARFTAHWRHLAEQAGLGGLYLVAMGTDHDHPCVQPFDAVLPFGPGDFLNHQPPLSPAARVLRRLFSRAGDTLPDPIRRAWRLPARYDYRQVVEEAFTRLPPGERHLPCVLTGWDNTPRAERRGVVFENFSPELLRLYLRKALQLVAQRPAQTRLVFLKAWNEWAEGNVLEPDETFGTALLDVVREEVVWSERGDVAADPLACVEDQR